MFGRKPPTEEPQENWPQNPPHLGGMHGPFPPPPWGARGPHPWGPRGPPPPHMMGGPPFGPRGFLPPPFMARGPPGGPIWGPRGPMRGPVPHPSGFDRSHPPSAAVRALKKRVSTEDSINMFGNFFKDNPIGKSKVSLKDVDGGVARKRFKDLEEIKKDASFARFIYYIFLLI